MALIKLTAIVDNISGKLNGSVFARNKGGHYVRSKSNPTNPQTGKQMGVRAIFGGIASAWRNLTAGQREAWNNATADYPYQNKLGDTKTLSGFSLHQKLNRNLLLVGAPVSALPQSPVYVAAPTATVVTNPSAGLLSITGSLDTNSDSGKIVVYGTGPLSPGVNNFQTRLRLLGTITQADYRSGKDITSLYTAKFSTPVIGSKLGFQVVNISDNTGQASSPDVTDVLVTI